MPADVSLLAQIPFFALLDDQERATLAQLVDTVFIPQGTQLFHRGDAGESMYAIRSGRVEIYTESHEGERLLLNIMEPGELFGEVSLLDGGPRTASAVTLDDCEMLIMNRDDLVELVGRHPHAAIAMLTVVGQRLRSTDEFLRAHASRNPNVEEEEHMTFAGRLADRVAAFGGSWTFILLFGAVLIVWMGGNTFLLLQNAFDPYPFIFLNLLLSTVSAIQAPVIMMSQNRQSYKDRLKSDIEYEVNLKAELEISHLHRKVDRLYDEMQAHFSHVKKAVGSRQ
jgi:CRP/FNR family cyclic AMP-dependent transcriptional regulator